MKKPLVTLALLIMTISLILSGCSSNTTSNSEQSNASNQTQGKENESTQKSANNGPSDKLSKVTVAYHPNMGGASALAVGQKMGYFEKAGIELELLLFQTGTEELSAMASGKLDFGYVGTGPIFMPMKGMAKILTIDNINLNDAVVVSKDSGIKEVADLKGKKILVPLGTTAQVSLFQTLKLAGLTLDDVEQVNTKPSEQVTAFVTGKAPVVAGWSPITDLSLEKSEGSFVLASDNDLPSDVVLPSVWAASNDMVKNNPDLVKRFTWAILKSIEYRNSHMDEAITLTSKLTEVTEELNKSFADQTKFPDPYEMVTQFNDGTSKVWFDNLSNAFVEMGRLDSVPDFSSYTDVKLLKEASELKIE